MAVIDLNGIVVAVAPEDNNGKKNMIYTADDGTTQYLVNINEAVGEAFGFADVTNATPVLAGLPRGYSMRKVTFSDASGKVAGSYPVGNPNEQIYNLGGTITVPRKGSILGTVVQVTGSQGERKRLQSANDTAQQLGDNT